MKNDLNQYEDLIKTDEEKEASQYMKQGYEVIEYQWQDKKTVVYLLGKRKNALGKILTDEELRNKRARLATNVSIR